MKNSEYYQNQINAVNVNDPEFAPQFKIISPVGGKNTKHLNLNKQSATILIKWLQDNFIK